MNPNINAYIADYAYWGRAEAEIVDAIKYIEGKTSQRPSALQIGHDSKGVVLRTHAELHPKYDHHTGCGNRCLFCHFSWTHKPMAWFDENDPTETTVMDVVKRGSIRSGLNIMAIDGSSERLRWLFGKRIRDEHFAALARITHSQEKPTYINYYNVVGFPTETQEERESLIKLLVQHPIKGQLTLTSTILSPMPLTPLAYCTPKLHLNQRTMYDNVAGYKRYPAYMAWGEDEDHPRGSLHYSYAKGGSEGVVCRRLFVLRADEQAAGFKVAASRNLTRMQEIQLAKKLDLDKPIEIGHHPTDVIKVEGVNHIHAARNLFRRLGGVW